MQQDAIVFAIFLVFTGAAVLATAALYARQSLLVAYMVVGVLLGPSVFGLVNDPDLIRSISEVGITFLLFLLGLNLQPQDLIRMVRKTTVVTFASSLIFFVIGFSVAILFGFTLAESLIIGGAATFSSTIIGLKLLPTTILHHQRTGEVIVSILLLQDLVAIVLLLVVQGGSSQAAMPVLAVLKLLVVLPLLIGFAWLFERHVLLKLIRRFDKIREYIFLVTIGWCLGLAEFAALLGLSTEIGAFIAGVVLASSPIAMYIAESLRPLRDFFLVLFFFSLGAGFDFAVIDNVLLPAGILLVLLVLIKPPVFAYLLRKIGESAPRSTEVGFRLGQMSEFSLLLAVLAEEQGVIGKQASYLIQLTTLMTFLVSSYLIVHRFPTPIAVSDELRRD